MFNSNETEQKINKLLILHALNKINFPIPNYILSDLFLINNTINYFTFQECLSQLIDLNFVKTEISQQNTTLLSITDKGCEALTLFGNDIPQSIKNLINSYIDEHVDSFIKYNEIKATCTKISEGHYKVELALFDEKHDLIKITLDAPSNSIAQNICNKWEKEHYNIFNEILDIFTKN